MVSWHIELLCEALEHVLAGDIRFLIVEMPPRHSKSLNVSQLLPAFVVGKDEDASVIVSSYSGDLATDHGRETRKIIESQRYRNLFQTRLSQDSNAKGKWNTDGKGAYNAVGVGGSVTGKGAKIFVVDDPFKDRKEADSMLIRDDRWKWLKAVARTRLTPDGAMIIMHTRWHQDDMIGRLTGEYDKDDSLEYAEDWVSYFDWLKGKRAKWVRLTLPGIAEEDEPFRGKGQALWPSHYSLSELLDIKEELGPYEFSALYQQRPIDDASREFKTEYYKYATEEEMEFKSTVRYLTVDTAFSKVQTSDDTGFCDNRVDKENFWFLRAWRQKLSPEELVEALFALQVRNKYAKIGIEKTAYLVGLKPYLDAEQRKRQIFLPIVELEHKQTSKEIRIRALLPRYAAGSIVHIKGACGDLENQQSSFPLGAKDDVLDAAAYQIQLEPVNQPRRKKRKNVVARGTGMRAT